MPYKKALYDDSDPLYAPGLCFIRGYAFWRPTKKYRDAGYPVGDIALSPGREPDPDRARICREETRKMIAWLESEEAVKTGTWEWLINRYLTDKFSRFHKVKANTRDNYAWALDRWIAEIGHIELCQANYEFFVNTIDSMKDEGRSDSYIKRLFTCLRLAVTHGVLIEDPEAMRIKPILSEMRIKNPKPRKSAPTSDEIMSIIREADRIGKHAYATGLLMQWWFSVRAVDIFGHYLDGQWQDGLTWNMINRDVTLLVKDTSKTGFPLEINLTSVPEVRERLLAIPMHNRIGPVIIAEGTGRPFTRNARANTFRALATAVGVSDDVWMMDTRAGAISEGQRKGATPYQLRDAAQHTEVSTTDRYARNRSHNIDTVIKLRRGA